MNQFNRRSIWMKIHLDWALILGICAATLISLVILYSAKEDIFVVKRQLIRVGIAAACMFVIAQIPPRLYRGSAYLLYVISLLLLIGVLWMGDTAKGAQRWLNLGVVRFQPSEMMKFALPMMLARFFESQILPPAWYRLILPTAFIGLTGWLIMRQPDLGTAILITSTGFWVIFFAGISWRLMTFLTLLGVGAAPFAWALLHDYQRQRILTLLNPERNPLGAGYQIIQSKIAIGSGGFWGKGFLNGTQSHLEYLPERTTDFIFAVLSEEFGFVGILCLMAIYFFMIIRSFQIGIQAQDTFSRLLAGSLTMTFFISIFVNMGMVSGILPVVGVPLPLISYGGTSMVTLMLSFGMLMSIHTHRSLVQK